MAADLHRLSPALMRVVADFPRAPEELVGLLQQRRTQQVLRHLRALEDLRDAGNVLDNAGLSWIVMKGPVLASRIWPHADMRLYVDLDIVVDRQKFAVALEVLARHGLRQVDRNWRLLAASGRAEVAMRGRFGTPVDLHWDVAVPPELRRAFATDIDAMMERSRVVTLVPGCISRTLDPVDTVIHLVLHAAQSGAGRLVWLADIRFATMAPGFEWDEYARRVRAAKMDYPSALVIDRVQRVLGFDDPPERALVRKAYGAWGQLARLRDKRIPFPGLPGDRHLGGNFYSGTRASLLSSAATVLREHLSARRYEARLAAGGAARESLEIDVPDRDAMARYFAMAASGR
jgi:hypothetical protein